MDASFYKKFEPIDGKWYLSKELGRGAFGVVYEVYRKDFPDMRAAMKIISIPSSSSEVDSYRKENYDLDEQSVTSYFYSFVEEFTKEFLLMAKMKGCSNIVSYEDHDIVAREGEVGWDIFIRMELLTPMTEFFAKKALDSRDVIKLGIDICKALEICKKHQIIHRDIKPGNIFISNTGEFKLGDFGVARTLEKTSSGLSKKGTYVYMAPEVYLGKEYGASVDIYSLGIVMYKLLNNSLEPFRTDRTYSEGERAMELRMRGEKEIPLPANAEQALGEIIVKACAFKPEDRYREPQDMRKALEVLLEKMPDTAYSQPLGASANKAEATAPQSISSKMTYPPAVPVSEKTQGNNMGLDEVVHSTLGGAINPGADQQTVGVLDVSRKTASQAVGGSSESPEEDQRTVSMLDITPTNNPQPVSAPIESQEEDQRTVSMLDITPTNNSQPVSAPIESPADDQRTVSIIGDIQAKPQQAADGANNSRENAKKKERASADNQKKANQKDSAAHKDTNANEKKTEKKQSQNENKPKKSSKKLMFILLAALLGVILVCGVLFFVLHSSEDEPSGVAETVVIENLPSSISLIVGQEVVLEPTLSTGDEGTVFEFLAVNPEIADVDSNGVLVGVSTGTAYVKVTAGDVIHTIEIEVQESVDVTQLNLDFTEVSEFVQQVQEEGGTLSAELQEDIDKLVSLLEKYPATDVTHVLGLSDEELLQYREAFDMEIAPVYEAALKKWEEGDKTSPTPTPNPQVRCSVCGSTAHRVHPQQPKCPECGSTAHTVHPQQPKCPDCGSTAHTVHPRCPVCNSTDHTVHPQPSRCPECGSAYHTVHPAERCPECGSISHTIHP